MKCQQRVLLADHFVRGGIPALLVVCQTNDPVRNFVAEPVEITDEVERQGELLIRRDRQVSVPRPVE